MVLLPYDFVFCLGQLHSAHIAASRNPAGSGGGGDWWPLAVMTADLMRAIVGVRPKEHCEERAGGD